MQTAGIVCLGILIRLAFLVWVEPLELQADEGSYVYQALAWNHFGFYVGSVNWLWPPAYPAFLALFFRLFGEQGLLAAQLAQVLMSGAIGLSVILIARRLFSPRAGLVAGLMWTVYLPLIGFTHYLWPETLFLALLMPAVVLFLSAADAPGSAPMRLLGVGVLLGATGLIKQATLPLLVFLPLLILLTAHQLPLRRRVAHAAILVLSAVAVLLPWTLRTHEVYGHAVASATLGENLYQGVNAGYVNYDYARKPGRPHIRQVDPDGWTYRWLVRWPKEAERWERSENPNPIRRDQENAARGKRFARDYPGFYVRSRVKKLADWVTPLNFFQRRIRLQDYSAAVPSKAVRGALVLGSVGMTAFLLAASIGGLFLAVRKAGHRWLMLALVITFLSGIAVVSMSRYRVQVEPCLLVLAAGFLTEHPWIRSRTARCLAVLSWLLLAVLWWINSGEVAALLRESLR